MNRIPNRVLFLALVISSNLSAITINVPTDSSTIQAEYTDTGLAETAVASAVIGVWKADATTGTLGNTAPGSGSLAGGGWTSYTLTLTNASTFSITGGNVYGVAAYGSTATTDSTITYSGTYTIDASASPMEIDLTCTASDLLAFFTTDATLQPMQPGIFALSDDKYELTIQWGAAAFSVPRPTAFLVDANGDYDSGTLVQQFPLAPTGLVAVAGNQQIVLTWSANRDSDFLKYYVYGGTTTSPTTQVDSTAGGDLNDTTANITGLSNGTTYYYRITAVDSVGNESGFSIEVSETPFPPDPIITSINDVPKDQGRWVHITWQTSDLDYRYNAITQYGVWEMHLDSGWVGLGNLPALQDSAYTYLARTYGDSNDVGIHCEQFQNHGSYS